MMNRQPNHASRSRKGFTLVELTVVMTIIAILAAILFPVFNQAREASKKTHCLSNLTQIGLALQLYARDYDGRFPRADNDLRPLGPYMSDASVLRCPTDWTPEPAWPGWNGISSSSYQYRGGRSIDERADLPLAADWEFLHSNTASVLYLSGNARIVNISNWRSLTRGRRPLPAELSLPTGITPTPYIGEVGEISPSPGGSEE